MEGIISHPAAGGLPSLQFPQQLQGAPVIGFPHSMQLCGPSALNPYSAAAGAADLLHPLGSFPANLQAQQQQPPAALCEPTQFMKLLQEDSPKQQQHAHSDDPSDDVAAAPAAAAAPLPLPARLFRTNTGNASHTSSSTGVAGQERTARESDGHQSAPPAEQTAAAAAAPTPASSGNKDGITPAAHDTAAAAVDGQTAAIVPDASAAVAPKGLRVDLASPVGPKILQGTLLSPGANIEELEGCCQALMMLGAMQQQQQQQDSQANHAAAAHHTKANSRNHHPQHQQLQRVAGRAARSSSSGGRGAAAAAAGDRDSAGSVHTAAGAADGQQRRGSEQGHPTAIAAGLGGADSEAASGGSQQGLGRGKRQRKPHRWNEQMLMLDQIVARELGSSAAAEGAEDTPEYAVAAAAAAAYSGEGCGSGAASDGEQHGRQRKRRQQSNLAVAGAPAAAEGDDAAAEEQQQQQYCSAGGSSRRRRGSFEGEDWAAEDDVSYDAAADLAGADSADYEIEEEMDIDDEEYDVAAAKRGSSRGNGGSGSNSRLRRAAALQRAHGSSRKSRRANAPMYESEAAVPANGGSASFLGVSKKRSGKWQAAVRFGHDGAYAFWCCYGCPRVAARARDAAALALRGPGSARLNFPEESYTGDEIMAAAASILAKHPQLALDHPLVMGMGADEVAAAAAAGGNELAAVLGGDGDEAGEQEDAEAAAADRASPAAAPAPKHQRNTRSKRSRRGAAAAAAAAESPAAAAEPHQQGVDAAVLSRCFDLAALVLFGAGAVTEAPVGSFTEEELTAAATAMSCRLPAGTEGRQQLLAALGGAAGMLQGGGEVAGAAAGGQQGDGAPAEQQVKEEGGVSDMQQ